MLAAAATPVSVGSGAWMSPTTISIVEKGVLRTGGSANASRPPALPFERTQLASDVERRRGLLRSIRARYKGVFSPTSEILRQRAEDASVG